MTRLLVVATVSETIRGFLLPWASHYREKGWQVDALAQGISNCSHCTEAFNQVWEIQWSRNPLNPLNLIAAPRRLHEIAKGYDLIHVHTPVAAFVTRFALRDLKKQGQLKGQLKSQLKVIYTAHGFHFHRNGSQLRNEAFLILEKLAGRWCDRLVVINQDDQKAALNHHLVPQHQLCYMPGIGLDLNHYSNQSQSETDSGQVRQELKLHQEDVLFLAIAELIPRKRHADILEAIARLQQPQIHLAVAGDGPLAQSLRDLSQQLGLANQIRFLGFRTDIPQLMSAARASILVSEQEGLPRSVMESLAMGLPVIGSRIRGTEDLLASGGGCLVEVGNVDDIAQAIQWMAAHPDEAAQMGQKGRQHSSVYDISNILARHDALYAEVLA
jgi:glycosyltransferase involved in cell wall biosynthesis